MTALLTDEEIRQFVIVFARDWKARTGKNSRHVRIEFAIAAAAHVLSAQEARLAEDAKREALWRQLLNHLDEQVIDKLDADGSCFLCKELRAALGLEEA